MPTRPAFDPSRLRHKPRPEAQFVTALAQYQDTQGIRDIDFAAQLGVSPALWRQTRGGRYDLGYKLLIAGGDYVPARIYQAADASLAERMRDRLKGNAA